MSEVDDLPYKPLPREDSIVAALWDAHRRVVVAKGEGRELPTERSLGEAVGRFARTIPTTVEGGQDGE